MSKYTILSAHIILYGNTLSCTSGLRPQSPKCEIRAVQNTASATKSTKLLDEAYYLRQFHILYSTSNIGIWNCDKPFGG